MTPQEEWEREERIHRTDPNHPFFAACIDCDGSGKVTTFHDADWEVWEVCSRCKGEGWDNDPIPPLPPRPTVWDRLLQDET